MFCREMDLRVQVDGYKTEHSQLITAHTQLLEQNQGLSKKVGDYVYIVLLKGMLLACLLHSVLMTTSSTPGQLIGCLTCT